MNPVRQFEVSAMKAWGADATEAERARRLEKVGLAIHTYVERARATANVTDPWQRKSIDRSLSYLENLEKDVRDLATTCLVKA